MTATATTTDDKKRPAKKAKKPTERKLSFNAEVGALFLTVDGEESNYWVDRLAARWDGGLAVRLTKFVAQQKEGEPDGYEVRIDRQSSEEPMDSCECKGFTFRKKCKHVDSVRKLAELGRIS